MARIKEREWEKVGFNIDPEINERITELAQFEGVTRSNFIELLVSRWDEGINPQSKLNSLFKKREILQAELHGMDSEITKLTTEISAWDASKRDKAKRKPEAIRILTGLLENNEVEQAEKIARFWQTKTGISSFELLMEARDNIKKKNNPTTFLETKHL